MQKNIEIVEKRLVDKIIIVLDWDCSRKKYLIVENYKKDK